MNIVFTIIWEKFAAGMRHQKVLTSRSYLIGICIALALAILSSLALPLVRTTPSLYPMLVLQGISGFCMIFGLLYILIAYEKKWWIGLVFSLLLLFWFQAVAEPMFDSEYGDAILASFFTGFMVGWVAMLMMHYKFAKLVGTNPYG